MNTNIPEESTTSKALQRLRRQEWRQLWIQGGFFAEISRRSPGVYSAPSLTVEATDLFRIGAMSIELAEGNEAFPIYVLIEPEIGTLRSERLWRPQRKQIREFPPDLDLSPFLNTLLEVSLFRRSLSENLTKEANDYSYCDAIHFRASTHELLIQTDEYVPESILIARDADFVHEVLSNRTVG